MKLLLDTHMLLWAAMRPDLLPADAADLLNDLGNTAIFSVVSLWEVAIKFALRRADFDTDPVVLRADSLSAGYNELPIIGAHANAVATLPLIHRDPFDRLLIAQAIVEGVTLLTADPVLARYPAPVRLV
jgi:PIN domain nuclease of toxin-antitoxin system